MNYTKVCLIVLPHNTDSVVIGHWTTVMLLTINVWGGNSKKRCSVVYLQSLGGKDVGQRFTQDSEKNVFPAGRSTLNWSDKRLVLDADRTHPQSTEKETPTPQRYTRRRQGNHRGWSRRPAHKWQHISGWRGVCLRLWTRCGGNNGHLATVRPLHCTMGNSHSLRRDLIFLTTVVGCPTRILASLFYLLDKLGQREWAGIKPSRQCSVLEMSLTN